MAANIVYTICSSHSTCTIRKKNARKKYFLEFQKLVSLVEEYMLVLTISKCLLLKLETIWVILLLLSNKTFFYKNFGILVGCISISLLNGRQNWNSCNRFLMWKNLNLCGCLVFVFQAPQADTHLDVICAYFTKAHLHTHLSWSFRFLF